MSGNATFGSGRTELQPGDYPTKILAVELSEFEDQRNLGQKRGTFTWSVRVQNENGGGEDRKLFTSRTITDMSQVRDPQFVSTLNKLIRACGMPVPQSAEEVADWDEQDLVGCSFLWRVERDEETGASVRKFLPLKPKKTKDPFDQE